MKPLGHGELLKRGHLSAVFSFWFQPTEIYVVGVMLFYFALNVDTLLSNLGLPAHGLVNVCKTMMYGRIRNLGRGRGSFQRVVDKRSKQAGVSRFILF